MRGHGIRPARYLAWLLAVLAIGLGLVAMHQLSVDHMMPVGGSTPMWQTAADEHHAGPAQSPDTPVAGRLAITTAGPVAMISPSDMFALPGPLGKLAQPVSSTDASMIGSGTRMGQEFVGDQCVGCAGHGLMAGMADCLATVVLLLIAALIGPPYRRRWWLSAGYGKTRAVIVGRARLPQRPPLGLAELSVCRT